MVYNMTINGFVSCTPFPSQHIEKVVKGGFAMIDKKVQLQELEVVIGGMAGNDYLGPGSKVYIRGDQITQPWAREVFSMDGKDFILVPSSAIRIAKVSGRSSIIDDMESVK